MYQLISEKAIYQYFGDDDPEMVTEMITIILNTNLKDLKDMEGLYQQGDFATIKKRCHKAKPSMSYIGALTVRKTLEQIEENLENSHSLHLTLQSQLNIVETELTDFLSKLN
jgi:HPt (histidine-containing phosphotransfer) domain-containing protein